MFKNISLTLKMLLVTIVVGLATWSILDPIQSNTIERAFQQQISEKIREDADESLMLFDRYVQIFRQNVRLIVLQKQLSDYVQSVKDVSWATDRDGSSLIKFHTHYIESPEWMPEASVLRSFSHFHYAILTDDKGIVHEVYKNYSETPPSALLRPEFLFKQVQNRQSILLKVDGVLYLVAGEHLYGPDGSLMASLILVNLIDDEFVVSSQEKDHIVAFIEGSSRKILASNRSGLLPHGTITESLRDDYLYWGKSLSNHGSSDLKLELVTFVPKGPHEQLSGLVLMQERRNRIITALLLILSFSFIMAWITRRIKSLTDKVVVFSKQSLNIQQKTFQEGDEVRVLGECFRNLTGEIAASHESLRKQAESLQKERDMAQNYLDIAGAIILTLSAEGRVTLINRKGCSLLGYPEDEIIGKDWFGCFIPENIRYDVRAVFGKILAGDTKSYGYYECNVLNSSGDERLVAWHNTQLKDEKGWVIGVLSSGEDITERKTLERLLIETEERERRRIGQDLHDGLGQLLTGIAFKVRGLGRKLEKNDFHDSEDAAEISVLVDEAKKQASRISKGLYPIEVDREGLTTALRELAFYIKKTYGISSEFLCNYPVYITNKTAVLQLYRIAQEAVTNAVKHGKPERIEISLSQEKDKIAIVIRDNGTGIPDVSEQMNPGMGLKIMSYRASLINATLDVRRDESGGTVVTCVFSDTHEALSGDETSLHR
ncbi:MAG: PAS domain S-box protein [Nitrospiraceae bacterium]|nr:MAG: PAS domain S-box protein [Nitrospiraceae bacterium]